MSTLTILGSAGGSPTRTNPASGYLLESGATSIWIDAGTGAFMELARHTDPGALNAVTLSHIHVDHCSDIFGLYGYLAFGPSGVVPVPVFLPQGASEHLAAFARAVSRATKIVISREVIVFVFMMDGSEKRNLTNRQPSECGISPPKRSKN